jgi:flagellar basal-body rod protein FlgB
MTFHRERHAVLAGNVANVDTPGYRPLDLKRHEHVEGALEMAPAGQSDAASMESAPTADYVTAFDDGGSLQGPDGNAVSIERELAKVDANRTRYETASELVSRRLAVLRYAAGDGT